MARSRFIPNLLYGTLGLAVTGVAVYYSLRTLRRRREAGEDSMLSVRRASRKAGRAAKETGKTIGRGIEDAGDKVEDFATSITDQYATPTSNRI